MSIEKMVAETLDGFKEFEQWEKEVDMWLEKLYGMGIDFMPDWNTYDEWKYGDMTPKQAAKQWYKDAQDY